MLKTKDDLKNYTTHGYNHFAVDSCLIIQKICTIRKYETT